MGGRAGRVGLDTHGDVHVLIRSAFEEQDRAFCTIIQPITSQIADADSLAFHLVSEIAEGNVETYEDAVRWYVRSLAFHQKLFDKGSMQWDSPDALVTDVLDRLLRCGALKIDTQKRMSPTAIGKVASWFYFSPFDIASWVDNFKTILKGKPSSADIAWAVGNTASARKDYPVKLDRVTAKMNREFTNKWGLIRGGAEKHIFAVYCILTDSDPKRADLSALITGYRIDSERTAQAIEVLGTFGNYFNHLNAENVILELPYRIRYGCGEKGLELLMLPGVGRKTVKQLMTNRHIFSCKELVAAQELGHQVFPAAKWGKLQAAAKEIARIGHIAYIKKSKDAKRANR